MMTKNEERKVLEQIVKLIESTGEDSYIAAAFAGCASNALLNIENDWALSHETTIQSANNKILKLTEDLNNAAAEIELLNRDLAKKEAEKEELRTRIRAEKKKQIPEDLYRDIWLMIDGVERKAIQDIERTAEILSLYADEPQDIAVASGLKQLRVAQETKENARMILTDLERYEPKK